MGLATEYERNSDDHADFKRGETYFVAVTAYDTSGNESGCSAETSFKAGG